MKRSEPNRSKTATGSQVFPHRQTERKYVCDRCGAWMVEWRCKAVCPNCGCQFDCSDLTIHLDELDPGRAEIIKPAAMGLDGKGG